jgi:SAM-dependent methyltransferase
MDEELRKRIHQDLLNLVDVTLADAKIGPRIKKLLVDFKISVEQLKKEVLAYTLDKDVDNYENKQYQKIVARLTLFFHNLVGGTYHRQRHNLVLSFLRKVKPKTFIDVGYGTPGLYLLDYLKEDSIATVTLADQDKSAEEFSTQVFLNEAPELLSRVKFMTYDMDSQKYPGDFDAYLYLDSIEHTQKPTEYLQKMAHESKHGSHFIFSLPVCKMKGLENFHYAEWLSDDEARKWVQDAGLKIIDEGTAYPNPEVDYFAELVDGGYHNYLVLAKKG